MRTLILLLLTCASMTAADKPNVVFILADDLGINDLGCYGRHEHRTPNLDKLAADGVRLTQAYAACPVCSPTRAAIMTGKYPARLHLTTFLPGRKDAKSQKLLHPVMKQQLPLEEITLAERFKAEGYATACIGKWHLGHSPREQGFEAVYEGKANFPPGAGKGEYDLTSQAVDFINTNKDKPFFLYLAHNAPHIALTAKRELIERYSDTYNPTYAAILHTLDDSIGQLLSTLDRHKLTEKTIVIFTSDNGGLHIPEGQDDAPTYNSPYRAGKGFLHDGGLRVPLIVRYPGQVMAASECRAQFLSTDWVPTLATFCGLPAKETLDGQDMSKVLRGENAKDRLLFWHFPHYTNQGSRPGGALRDADFKLIENYEDGSLELYNLGIDPGETSNLADTLPAIAETYRAKLADWRKATAVQENTPNPNFDAAAHKAIYKDVDVSKPKIGKTAKLTSDPLREWRKKIDEALKGK